jgi:hypothetical protein
MLSSSKIMTTQEFCIDRGIFQSDIQAVKKQYPMTTAIVAVLLST